MSKQKRHQRLNKTADDGRDTSAPADASAEDVELLLLALLDRLQSDYAAGCHPDLTAYCAANPDLEDAFLSLALTMDPPGQEEEPPKETDYSREVRALSPGVLRALASIAEITGDADDLATGRHSQRQAQVAEEPGNYDLETRAPHTSKGDS